VTLHIMSDNELGRLEVLRDLTSGRLTISAATELLGLERRQIQRLAKAYQDQGATALISKKRGRPSNRQMPESFKVQVLAVIRERYADLGPILAAEKLRAVHGMAKGNRRLGTFTSCGAYFFKPLQWPSVIT
jgi:transposase